ncbi:MAG: DNA polymerase III subunit beta [Nitrospirae bacterium]|nr:DNA polymerase III subunit beta [Nitrospirota bacterium]
MKLTVSRESLLKGLQVIQGIVEAKSTISILSHMLLSSGENGTTISATDLEIAVREPLEAAVHSTGSACIPAKKLYEIVREINSQEITIEQLENNWINITGGRSKFRLIGLPEKDFPQFPDISGGESITMAASDLSDIINKTLYATGDNDARYSLNGLLFHANPSTGRLVVVGTDGHRLAVASKDLAASLSEERKVILPRKAASEARKLADSTANDITISFNNNNLVFSVDGIVMISRLIEGSYPNYEQVIPRNNEKRMKGTRTELLGAVKRAALVGREKTFTVRLEISEGLAVFSSNNPELGEANEPVEVEYSGEPLTLGFNARHTVDLLQAMNGEFVTMELQDSLIPAIIRETGNTDYFCVLMPMRT